MMAEKSQRSTIETFLHKNRQGHINELEDLEYTISLPIRSQALP